MNYILFNSDGSIKKTNFTESIQQNNDGENEIFVSISGLNTTTHSLVGVFVLPDGTVSEEAGDQESDIAYEGEGGPVADGYVLPITLNETKLDGVVFLTIQVIRNSDQKTLYSYRVALTINKTASLSSLTLINLAQYNALKGYIDSNFAKEDELSNFLTESNAESTYVPYTNANSNVNLGTHDITSAKVIVGGPGTTDSPEKIVVRGYGSISEPCIKFYNKAETLYTFLVVSDEAELCLYESGQNRAIASRNYVSNNYVPLTGATRIRFTDSNAQIELANDENFTNALVLYGLGGVVLLNDDSHHVDFALGEMDSFIFSEDDDEEHLDTAHPLIINGDNDISVYYGGTTESEEIANHGWCRVNLASKSDFTQTIQAGEINIYVPPGTEAVEEMLKIGPSDWSLQIKRDRIIKEVDGATNTYLFDATDNGGSFTLATREWASNNFVKTDNTNQEIGGTKKFTGTVKVGEGYFYIENDENSYLAEIKQASSYSANRTFELPNKSGTIALTQDIVQIQNAVPYSGAVGDVDLGNNGITAKSFNLTDSFAELSGTTLAKGIYHLIILDTSAYYGGYMDLGVTYIGEAGGSIASINKYCKTVSTLNTEAEYLLTANSGLFGQYTLTVYRKRVGTDANFVNVTSETFIKIYYKKIS